MVIIERQTSEGVLIVDVDRRGRVTATLGARALYGAVTRLPTPVKAGGGVYTHRIDKAALTTEEATAIETAASAARAAYAETPRGQREALTDALAACERGAYPGSAAWRRESAALAALADFDRRHPEVLAEIRAKTPTPDPGL